MKVGIDFDNTIINYNDVFYKSAVKNNFINPYEFKSQTKDKNDIKNFFVNRNQENIWTEIQGIVYGKDINEAKPYKGIIQFLEYLKNNNHQFYIVSHKTRFPFIGEKINLHHAAIKWIRNNLDKYFNINYFFEETIELKINRIVSLEVDVFIDDLEKILLHPNFPKKIKKIHFNSNTMHSKNFYYCTDNWTDILRKFKSINQ